MKKFKFLSMLVAVLLSFSMCIQMVGCGISVDLNEDDEEYNREIDKSMTQIYIGNYNGGIGYAWLENAINEFEEYYNQGKTGKDRVQLMIDNDKTSYEPATLKQNINTNRQEMYVLDKLDYYEFANLGYLADITDAVIEGGENSIENRMNASLKDYYKMPAGFAAQEGHYYAVPFYQSFNHLVYDKDLFSDMGFYLSADGTNFVTPDNDLFGVEGTWNYGLPKTYSQFFNLLDYIYSSSCTPIIYTGQYSIEYVTKFLSGVAANYMGAANFAANFSLDGTLDVFADYNFAEPSAKTFSLDLSKITQSTLTSDNWQDSLSMQPGLYFMLKFAKDLADSKYIDTIKSTSQAESHTLAQDDFLRSRPKVDFGDGGRCIAMIIEGGWWLNEAQPTSQSIASKYGEEYSLENRNFGVMAFPFSDDDLSNEKNYTISCNSGVSAICIAEKSTHKEVLKEFLRFIHTDKQVKQFAATTNVVRPYSCTYTAEEREQYSSYLQDIIEISETANIQFSLPRTSVSDSKTKVLISKASEIYGNSWLFQSYINSSLYSNPLQDFLKNKDLKVMDYFKGIKTYKNSLYRTADWRF